MSVHIDNEQNYELPFDYQKVAKDVIEKVLDMEQCPYETEVNVTLTDNEEIRQVNREFREIDRETDVLSFPMIEFPNPAKYDILDKCSDAYFNPDSGELMLGDIMISIPKAKEQAAAYGHELKREYAFLIAHSVLHLLGYDHMDDQEMGIMEKKQEAALQALEITR